MKTKRSFKNKLKRTILIPGSILLLLVGLVIFFISPITKYLVEKYDVKFTGRQIVMDRAYVNPFTGYVYFSGLKFFEANGKDLFFFSKGVGANFSMLKLFSENYEISELILDEPNTVIAQNKKKLNLDDIIEKFSSKGKPASASGPVKFSILSIKINKGTLHYFEAVTPVHISVVKLNLISTGIKWNSDTIAAKFSLLSGNGKGEISGDFAINTKNLDYRIASVIHKLDLNFINQYLDDFSNYGNFSAVLDADIKSTGNFTDAEVLDAKGKVIVNAFHFGKDSTDDYASLKKLVVDVNQLNPKNHKYLFDSVLLTHPFLKYEQYDYLDNFQQMFGKNGGIVTAVDNDPARFNLVLEIGKYIRLLSKNFLASDYQVNRFSLAEGEAVYNNYTLNEKFSLSASPLFISGESIDKNHKRVELAFSSFIQPYGNASVLLSINPKDSSDFDMSYHLQKLPLAMFNPYLVYYTSFPMDRGTLELNGKWTVRNGIIKSANHLVIIDPHLSKRLKNKSSKWIPMRLIMAIVKERGNVIDYEIPITGDLKKPKFHIKDVVFDVIENIFVNPATTSYRREVSTIETGLERSVCVQWEMRKASLPAGHERFISRLADFLSKNPAASVSVYPLICAENEKENILFFAAKKKYFLHLFHKSACAFSRKDSTKVEKMQLRDKGFLKYLTAYCNDSMLFTIQQKCYRYVGYKTVNAKFDELEKKREEAFRFYFLQNGTGARVILHAAQNKVQYNGFSFFSIKYNGKLPPELDEAYDRMERLNELSPRKKYLRLRKKDAVAGKNK